MRAPRAAGHVPEPGNNARGGRPGPLRSASPEQVSSGVCLQPRSKAPCRRLAKHSHGLRMRSAAVLGYALESFVDVWSSILVLYRFWDDKTEAEATRHRERLASFGISLTVRARIAHCTALSSFPMTCVPERGKGHSQLTKSTGGEGTPPLMASQHCALPDAKTAKRCVTASS